MHRNGRRWMSALLACAALVSAPVRAAELPEGTLQLENGGTILGSLQTSQSPATIHWQGTDFTSPFRFPLAGVHSIAYPQPSVLPRPAGDFCFELSGGDVLYGGLAAVSGDALEVESEKFGRLVLRRDQVRRIFRWNAGEELIYAGPNGMKGWAEETPGQWREEGGHLVTAQPDVKLLGDFKLPPQAAFELELSWRKRPNFALALGTTSRAESAAKAFRLEVIQSELVAQRETKRDADLAVVAPVAAGEGRVQLLAYLDQKNGRLLVYSMTGSLLADLTVPDPDSQAGGCVTLINFQGDVRLERLRIARWNGTPPTGADHNEARFRAVGGELVNGTLQAFDPEMKIATFRSADGEKTVPLGELQELVTDLKGDQPADPATRNLHLFYQDGTRLSGSLTQVSDTAIQVACPAVADPIAAPVAGLRFLQTNRPEGESAAAAGQREALELPGSRLKGRLVDGTGGPQASCLTWHPDLSETASPLRHGAIGRIVYRVPPPPEKKTPANASANINRRQAQVKMFDIGKILKSTPASRTQAQAAPPKPAEDRFLHLRSGDTIPCNVTSIDERGVSFVTSMSDATFVEHERVKAVELIKTKSMPKLAKLKRERLLTLPRMQRDSPPTQLICSRNGDFLRGRILAMTETELTVEVRLDVRKLARDRVAQIIWLHAEELGGDSTAQNGESDAAAQPPAAPAESTRVQVRRSDGIRLTFDAQQFKDRTLIGRSDVLGECRTELAQIDQLLIGDAIEQAAAELAYHRWKLHHATDPKFVAEESAEAGSESPLVGKPAPDFTLDGLDGQRFHLAACQGQVVVLDFWATWCGPCLQVMPQIEEVVGEFQDANVRLVAVNLEESAKQITATLTRHKLNVPVVLDQDGVVAHKYAAQAIPQTVIIDREGVVFRVFVGGGPQYAEELRAALKLVTEGAPAGDDAKAAPKSESGS